MCASTLDPSTGGRTAADLAVLNIPIISPQLTVAQVHAYLRGRQFDALPAVAVCDDGQFVGLVEFRELQAEEDDVRAASVMARSPAVVSPGDDQEYTALLAADSAESTVAVVDEEGELRGLIPPERLMRVLMAEHDEDMARLGGFMSGVSAARTATYEPVFRRFLHRMPWLLVGLAGALAAAALVGGFEDQLRDNVTLAFFVATVVYLADAVGTQTETVVIRGLSFGVNIRDIVVREVLTGISVGLVLAVLAYPLVLVGWGDSSVAMTLSLALFGAASTSTVVAIMLPWMLPRFGVDPAFGSGPIATVIQDNLTLAIYFSVA